MNFPEPQLVVQERCATGEGPLWNPFDRRLYWVDIPPGRLYCFNPLGGGHELCLDGPPIGGFTIQADGALLLFGAAGSVRHYHDGRQSTLIEELPAERETRFNDVIADPRGRVFCGTMPDPEGRSRLYRLELDGTPSLVLDGLGQANGMGFTPDGAALYLTDTKRGTITRFRYDAADGALSDPAVFVQVPEDEAPPDGLAVDADGRVWSARYGGGCLVGYDPSGREVGRIALPTSRVTSAGFGGADGRDLYITTAGGDEAAPAEDPGAGGLFRTRLPVAGRPEFRSRVGL